MKGHGAEAIFQSQIKDEKNITTIIIGTIAKATTASCGTSATRNPPMRNMGIVNIGANNHKTTQPEHPERFVIL
jgi:hypothetical protein